MPTPTGVVSGVRVAGQVIDADTAEPVSGASVTTAQISVPDAMYRKYITPPQPTTAMTDSNGQFDMLATLPNGWANLALMVRKPGYEGGLPYSGPWQLRNLTGDVLRLYRTLTIAADQTIETRVDLRNFACGWESWRCRRVVVRAEAGELLDVEVLPVSGPNVWGIVIGEPPLTGNVPPTQVTTSSGDVWILAGGDDPETARVRVTARKHGGQAPHASR